MTEAQAPNRAPFLNPEIARFSPTGPEKCPISSIIRPAARSEICLVTSDSSPASIGSISCEDGRLENPRYERSCLGRSRFERSTVTAFPRTQERGRCVRTIFRTKKTVYGASFGPSNAAARHRGRARSPAIQALPQRCRIKRRRRFTPAESRSREGARLKRSPGRAAEYTL